VVILVCNMVNIIASLANPFVLHILGTMLAILHLTFICYIIVFPLTCIPSLRRYTIDYTRSCFKPLDDSVQLFTNCATLVAPDF
jgi:hypothetical protein